MAVGAGLDLPQAIDLADDAVASPALRRDGDEISAAIQSGTYRSATLGATKFAAVALGGASAVNRTATRPARASRISWPSECCPIAPDCTAHTTLPCGSHTLICTTPGSSRTKRALSSAQRLGLRALWPASSSGRPLRSTARWAIAAVSVHSGSETTTSRSQPNPRPRAPVKTAIPARRMRMVRSKARSATQDMRDSRADRRRRGWRAARAAGRRRPAGRSSIPGPVRSRGRAAGRAARRSPRLPR